MKRAYTISEVSFEQKRAAERLPLDAPIDGTAAGMAVKIVELSAIGCKIEHKDKLSLNSSISLKFKWEEFPVDLRAKVMRMQLRPGMTYESGLKFAESLESAPDVMRGIIAAIARRDMPPEVANEIPVCEDRVEGEELPAAEDTAQPAEQLQPEEQPQSDDQLQPVTEAEAAERPAEAGPHAEAAPDTEASPDIEATPDAEADVQSPIEFEDIPVPKAQYVECSLDETGKWHRRLVAHANQPGDGFITLPGSDAELDELCKTYAYADPDTRRLIRITLELTATRKKD